MTEWHAKPYGAYARESNEAKDNAVMFYGVMHSLGWCLEAVCAALGNQGGESEYNPWRWGSDNILASTSPWIDQREPNPNPPPQNLNHAYGLFQQDPAGKYLHRQYAMNLPSFAPNYSDISGQPYDGDAQCRYLHWICSDPNGGEWDPNPEHNTHNMRFDYFYQNLRNENVRYLTQTFFWGYERGAWGTGRLIAADYWYDYLSGITPPTPPPYGTKKFPLIFYMKKHPF